jgi:transcriptional regulator with XRE-family HTH domain
MKNMKIKKKNINPFAEIKKSKNYSLYAKDADDRIRLAMAIYNKRIELGLSQQKLAKLVKTTQKVLSNIENADINPGFNLLNRIGESLQFQPEDWAKVHNFNICIKYIFVANNSETGGSDENKEISKLENSITSIASLNN